jgi:hypothetical protein
VALVALGEGRTDVEVEADGPLEAEDRAEEQALHESPPRHVIEVLGAYRPRGFSRAPAGFPASAGHAA